MYYSNGGRNLSQNIHSLNGSIHTAYHANVTKNDMAQQEFKL